MKFTALSIARPLVEALADRPFAGQVSGVFDSACNLIDAENRVIALTVIPAGLGPFSILLPGQPGLFTLLVPGQPALANGQMLSIGRWTIDLASARLWEPRLNGPAAPVRLTPAIMAILQPYAAWPVLPNLWPAVQVTARLAREAAVRLGQALREGNQDEQVLAAASLAGLGSGLTPAGDDYLVGVMTALWLTGQTAVLPRLAGAACGRTTALSAAFLKAAALGEFSQPWHHLAPALFAGDAHAVARAAGQIAQVGASSGRDALAGLVMSLVCLLEAQDFAGN